MDTVDLNQRDPNNLNDHLKVGFEDILGEPESIHSIDCVWKLSYACFTFWLNICYKINTLCYGVCIAAEWGCEFATVAFYHIWFVTPALRMFEINCAVFKKLYQTVCGCCVEPCCEACGALFKSFEKRG